MCVGDAYFIPYPAICHSTLIRDIHASKTVHILPDKMTFTSVIVTRTLTSLHGVEWRPRSAYLPLRFQHSGSDF
ncbi:hypothetical protein M378DRAFT_811133 [Amanita muscaria Koide BX008]|uniref:Uncharacterized protein n=1 Tax=Amanita muscaria (strain Koide BX008) TaxID=946122 RepID=A0A0C2T5Y4_AMAMK|nr:hypothetical protein M378DRAFT_811133 [Amanita muscaria Koide BX008]